MIVAGVPLPQGTVADVRNLVLRSSQGRHVPIEACVLARWPDRSAKWVLLTAPRFRIGAGEKAKLTLACDGRGACFHGQSNFWGPVDLSVTCLSQSMTVSPVTLRRVSGGIHISNGLVRFTVARRGRLVPRFEVRSGDKWEDRASGLDLSLRVERDGVGNTLLASQENRTIDIECGGPFRSVIAFRGCHASRKTGFRAPYVAPA